MATLYDIAHYCSWNGFPQDMKGYLGIDKASWTNKEFWFPYGANTLYGSKKKTRLQCICENIFNHHGCSRIQELLDNGAKPDIKDLDGMSPLSVCARNGFNIHLDIMKLLMIAGVDVNQKDNSGDSPIHYAASGKNIDIIKLLLNKNANINEKNNKGYSPLHIATMMGNLDYVNILLDAGANINSTNNRGGSPLSLAAFNNNIDIVKKLVERGADIHSTDILLGWTPIDNAICEGSLNIVKYLSENGAIITDNSFKVAIEEGCVNVLKYFKKIGLNAPTNSIFTLIENNNPKLIILLSKMGSNLNYIDNSGDTPLSLAMFNNSYECMEALCKLGVDMHTVDINTDMYPIQASMARGDQKAINILLNNGVNVNTIINNVPLLKYGIIMMNIHNGNEKYKMCVKEIINSSPDFSKHDEDLAEFAEIYGFNDIALYIRRAKLRISKKLL